MGRTKKDESLTTTNPPSHGSEKLQAVKIAMDQITKQYGTGSIMRLGDSVRNEMKVDVVPTGALALDIALGVGGLPRGRIVEIYGPEASGKTTICLHVIAEAQKMGGTAAFVDAEHALDPVRAEAIGINLEDLLIAQPDTGEQALEIAETLIRSGGVDVLVIDSVAALVPKAEIEGEMGDSVMGLQARLMSQAMRKLTGAVSKSKTVLIFTNQLRMKIGVMFGNPETTTGGQALKFYSSVRIDMRKIGNIQDSDKIVGSQHRAKVVKNKVAPPFRVAEFDIMNASGVSQSGGIVDVATELNIIQKTGSFFKYKGEVLSQGREAAKNKLDENPQLAKEIQAAVWKQIKQAKTTPTEIGEKPSESENEPDK
jgi:recombination protein RecA